MSFRVSCPNCQQIAIIRDSKEVSKGMSGVFVKDLYVHCHNKKCLATSVFTVAFSKYLNPPITTAAELAASMLAALPPEDRQRALELVTAGDTPRVASPDS